MATNGQKFKNYSIKEKTITILIIVNNKENYREVSKKQGFLVALLPLEYLIIVLIIILIFMMIK
ncbi:hypothetical protein [Spiroplasma sp. SV19]|uniref:hypothetical protein n=1 Tax=Spiroplasma sp. SV19 TaxID=2570468 RepID=UPI0024B76CC3|nr:hypothetical protein [Spiroplasma sp. SV19]WHQ36705.1 hypothetical protein E7Y35_02180 [Spiroplasma sp. SV19]